MTCPEARGRVRGRKINMYCCSGFLDDFFWKRLAKDKKGLQK